MTCEIMHISTTMSAVLSLIMTWWCQGAVRSFILITFPYKNRKVHDFLMSVSCSTRLVFDLNSTSFIVLMGTAANKYGTLTFQTPGVLCWYRYQCQNNLIKRAWYIFVTEIMSRAIFCSTVYWNLFPQDQIDSAHTGSENGRAPNLLPFFTWSYDGPAHPNMCVASGVTMLNHLTPGQMTFTHGCRYLQYCCGPRVEISTWRSFT